MYIHMCKSDGVYQLLRLRIMQHKILIQFSFSKIGSHTKDKEPSLLYYSAIAEKIIAGFIPFSKV